MYQKLKRKPYLHSVDECYISLKIFLSPETFLTLVADAACAAVCGVMLLVSIAEAWGWWLLGFGSVAHSDVNGWLCEVAAVRLFRTLRSTPVSDGTLSFLQSYTASLLLTIKS